MGGNPQGLNPIRGGAGPRNQSAGAAYVEQALCRSRRSDRCGVRVPVQQERISWSYAWAQIERAR